MKSDGRYLFIPQSNRLLVWAVFSEPEPAVWDTVTGKRVFRLEGASGAEICSVSQDGKRILIGPYSRGRAKFRLWDAETGRELLALELPPHLSDVEFSIRFSPDGHRLVAPRDRIGVSPLQTIWDATPRPDPKQP